MRSFLIPRGINPEPLIIRLPEASSSINQDEEWFELVRDGRSQKLRIHDYAAIFAVPGLYEGLVYQTLKCHSPRRIVRLLASVLEDWPIAMEDLRVLDLGAGNGIVAEHLGKTGVRHIVGLDLIPQAAAAARRDRPGAYVDFIVADLENLTPAQADKLHERSLNCLITVAALGFGDVPPGAFAAAYNLVVDRGWVAMTIKEDFLDPNGDTGFGRLVRRMIDDRYIEIQAHHRYCHRLSIAGEKLFYVALVARKLRPLPSSTSESLPREAAEAGTGNHIAVR